jgi:predicted RNase H-like HicB family nuclease
MSKKPMLTNYIQAAMRRATYELLGDGTFYGEIPGFQGVWANAATLEACREELQSALEDWMLVRISDRLPLPVVDGIDLNPQPQEVA